MIFQTSRLWTSDYFALDVLCLGVRQNHPHHHPFLLTVTSDFGKRLLREFSLLQLILRTYIFATVTMNPE